MAEATGGHDHAGCGHHHGPDHAQGHGHAHHHGHAHARASAGSARRLAFSLLVTATLMVVEALGGWLSGSLALLSDAGHMLADVAALGLALLAVLFGARKADAKRTFGFQRLEVLAAQINVGALFVLTGFIAWEAVERLRTPQPAIALGIMAGIAGVGLLANVVVMARLHGDSSLNTRSAFLHVMGDAVSSVAVLAGAGVMYLQPGATWIDPALSLGIGLLILWGAGRLVVEITDVLMESVPRHLEVGQIAEAMEQADEGVVGVHDLHVWTISSGLHALSAHVVVERAAVGRNDEILTRVKSRLRQRFGVDHTTLQIETDAYDHQDDVHQH